MQKSTLAFSQDGRALLARQQEIFSEVVRQSRDLVAEFKPGGSPQEIAAKQAELARRTFDTVVKNTKDIAELVRNMTGKGLRFAPATPGDEPAYLALHRALVIYDGGGSQVASDRARY